MVDRGIFNILISLSIIIRSSSWKLYDLNLGNDNCTIHTYNTNDNLLVKLASIYIMYFSSRTARSAEYTLVTLW